MDRILLFAGRSDFTGPVRVGWANLVPPAFFESLNIFSVLNMSCMAAQTLSHSTARPRALVPPGTPDWVTPALLEQTQEIWTKRGGIVISSDEALAIILRVSTLLDVLSRR